MLCEICLKKSNMLGTSREVFVISSESNQVEDATRVSQNMIWQCNEDRDLRDEKVTSRKSSGRS